MAMEIPERCANCPRMSLLKTAAEANEQKEDILIQQFMMSDELCGAGDMDAAMIARGSEDGALETMNVPQLSRMVLNAELETVKNQNRTLKETIDNLAMKCMGSVTLNAVQDSVAYEVTLCRSKEPANEYESPLNDDRDGSTFEVAVVKRDSAQ